jgi:hypothetical protein
MRNILERVCREKSKLILRSATFFSEKSCRLWDNVETYRGADKSLARPGRKQATAKEDFEFHISYL